LVQFCLFIDGIKTDKFNRVDKTEIRRFNQA
jgi:hypothetical protein